MRKNEKKRERAGNKEEGENGKENISMDPGNNFDNNNKDDIITMSDYNNTHPKERKAMAESL